MKNVKIDISKIDGFIDKDAISNLQPKMTAHHKAVLNKTGKGNDFLGWVDLPSTIDENLLKQIEASANKMRDKANIFVVIGIGAE